MPNRLTQVWRATTRPSQGLRLENVFASVLFYARVMLCSTLLLVLATMPTSLAVISGYTNAQIALGLTVALVFCPLSLGITEACRKSEE